MKAVEPKDIEIRLSADKGEIRNPVLQKNADSGGRRLSFELAPGKEQVVELRAQLAKGDTALSETWLYKWSEKKH